MAIFSFLEKKQTKPKIEFHEHEYDLYVITSKTKDEHFWFWDRWQKIATTLNPLVKSSRGNLGIRVDQLDEKVKGKAVDLKFGRLSWKEDSFKKWLHNSPLTKNMSENWLFSNTTIWSPIWTICENENCPPDFYFEMHNENFAFVKEELAFNVLFIIAVRRSLDESYLRKVKEVAINLSKLTNSNFIACRIKKWGDSSGSGFTNAINDMSVTKSGLFNNTFDWRKNKPSIEMLDEEDKWQTL